MTPSPIDRLSAFRTTPLTNTAVVRSWAVGQVLNATVVDVERDGTAATLQVGDQRLRAQLGGNMRVGQPVILQVVESGDQPVLARVQERVPAEPQQVQQQALRQRLPQAVPLPKLLPALVEAANGDVAGEALPARAAAAIANLLQVLPSLEDLVNPEKLKQTLRSSGTFLEAAIAEAPEEELQQRVARDFKAVLLRTADALHSTPASTRAAPEAPATPLTEETPMVRVLHAPSAIPATDVDTVLTPLTPARVTEQVRGGIAHIEVNQLRTLAEAQHGNNLWCIDLPVRDQSGGLHHLKLQIEEREAKREGQTQRLWSMSVSLDLEPLGPLHARVSLAGTQVHAAIWAEAPATAELIRSQVGWLETQLVRSGLEAADIQCLAGKPQSAARSAHASLIDTSV